MDTLSKINKKKREKRKKKTAEVFTPNSLVNEMLDKLPKEVWKEEKTFLDPACGNGNFLIWILARKISIGHSPIEALKTIYGIDIKKDNIRECRLRLLKIISLFEDVEKEHIKIILTNIKWLNGKKWPNGSLGYDMSFKANFNQEGVDKWYKEILEGELNKVDLPVEDNDTPEKYEDMFGIQEFSDDED
jgi:type I restriction-modification system DNA methylase subunit